MKRSIIILLVLSAPALSQTSLYTAGQSCPSEKATTSEEYISVTIDLKILLVQFDDVHCAMDSLGAAPRYQAIDFEKLLGSEGVYVTPAMYSPDGDEVYGSMSDYFQKMSGGNLTIHASVINRTDDNTKRPVWVSLGRPKQYYQTVTRSNSPMFEDALVAARNAGLDASTSERTKLAIIYAGNTYVGQGLNPMAAADMYLTSELQERPYNQEIPHARFTRIGMHCHEFAHILGIGHSSGSRADLMDSGARNGSVEGNAPAPLNAIARMKKGWATIQVVDSSCTEPVEARYSLTNPSIFKLVSDKQDAFLVENRRFDQTMTIGEIAVPDYNNVAFFPPAGPHYAISQGIFVWRIAATGDPYDPGYSSEGLIYASGLYGRTFPENAPSETDDGVPFPGVSKTMMLSPSSDPRDPGAKECDRFDSTKSHYTLYVPNTKRGTNVRMEILSEQREEGYFRVLFNGGNSQEAQSPSTVATGSSAPAQFELHQNFPNPFNPSTTITFELHEGAMVTLEIYSIVGKSVATLVNQRLQAGSYNVRFDGSRLASGTYFCRLTAGALKKVTKMILTK